MPRSPLVAISRMAARPNDADLDQQLVRAFLASRCEAAFAELVRRHGPMIIALCRRILSHTQDAEDAFQATFLVMARKAGSVRGKNLAGWLYRVAVRTALGVRGMRDRRLVNTLPARNHTEGDSLERREQLAILDEELDCLPELFRLPIILCELQGRSRKEAAAELEIPEGTLSSRLAAAKRKLARQLERRGVEAPAVVLTAAFAVRSSARMSDELTRLATAAEPGSVAVQVADSVVKSLFVAQLKGAVFALCAAGALVLGVIASGGAPGRAEAGAEKASVIFVDEATILVKELGDPDFETREAAGRRLRASGAKSRPALLAAVRDPNPEIAKRSLALLADIQADLRDEFAKQFDPKTTDEYDHPIWKRFVAITGDSRASRELFARIIANKNRLRTWDQVVADPAAAPKAYRDAVIEMGRTYRRNLMVSFSIPVWPCDTAEEAAYVLLLGSEPDTTPANLAGVEAAHFSDGEGRVHFAYGLSRGLEGKMLDSGPGFNPPVVAGLAGTDRVFAKLFAAWFVRRDPNSEVVPNCFRLALTRRVDTILPLARRYAGGDFKPKREVSAKATMAALELVAELGDRKDLPLFEKHFDDRTGVAKVAEWIELKPLPPPYTTEVRDVALGLALLRHGANPEDYDFHVRKDALKRVDGRFTIPPYSHFRLAFDSEASRAAAFKKARTWLAER